jgi:VWFA-related protein
VKRIAILLCIGLLGVPVWTVGETEQETRPIGGLSFVDEVEVTVVNVDVYVRDSKGNPVDGLTAEQFRIRQDGVEMPISNFSVLTQEVIEHAFAPSAPELPVPTAEPEVDTGPEIRPVYVVLYIDNENIQPLQRNRVLRNVREFVVETLFEPVQMMVVSYQRSLEVVQPFTDDSRSVNEALRSLSRISGGRVERDNERRRIIGRIQEIGEDPALSDDTTQSAAQIGVKGQIMAYAEEEANNLAFTLGALRQILGMLSGVEGRKSIVYVSSGLPMSPGLGLMYEYAHVFRDSSILTRRSQVDRTRDFQSLAAAANGQEVSLYTIDASGLNPLEGFGAEDRYASDPTASSIGMKNFQDSLRYLADATGGIAVVNTNDVSIGLTKIQDDLFSYYSLGYTISSSGQDRVHRIEVDLPDHPEHDLRYRRRFVEKSRETMVQDRVFSSLMVEIDENPMRLVLESGPPSPATGKRWTVPLHVSFPLESLALLPEGNDYVGRVVLFLGARDLKGRQSELQRQDHVVRVPAAEYEVARSQRFAVDVQLLLEENQHRVAVGLLDSVTRQASYERIVVTVP